MVQREVLLDAVFSILFGVIITALALIFLLIYAGFPFPVPPEDLVFLSIGLVLLGGIVIGVPVFVLSQRTVLGWGSN